jgi:very-short-patch-repair endonuclease
MKNYSDLNNNEKQKIIETLYEKQNKSFNEIAEKYNTYPNKVRRDAIKFGFKIKDKSNAQKLALANGRVKHPTKGKKRSEEIKSKIGASVLEAWKDLTPAQLQDRKQKSKEIWDNLSEDEKKNRLQKANQAVRESSKQGSKLEKFLLSKLIADGYQPQFHAEQTLSNTKLQIDILIPSMNVAIEIDGPSHFLPVWGDDSLKRNKKYDNKKTGLILGKGWILVRIQQTMDFSKSRSELIYKKLKESLDYIDSVQDLEDRTFIIKDK